MIWLISIDLPTPDKSPPLFSPTLSVPPCSGVFSSGSFCPASGDPFSGFTSAFWFPVCSGCGCSPSGAAAVVSPCWGTSLEASSDGNVVASSSPCVCGCSVLGWLASGPSPALGESVSVGFGCEFVPSPFPASLLLPSGTGWEGAGVDSSVGGLSLFWSASGPAGFSSSSGSWGWTEDVSPVWSSPFSFLFSSIFSGWGWASLEAGVEDAWFESWFSDFSGFGSPPPPS